MTTPQLHFGHQLLLFCVALGCGSLSQAPTAWAQGTTKKAATSQNITLSTRDGHTIHATYFPSTLGRNAPVAVLLHGKGGNRLAWQTGIGTVPGFAQALQTNDFAVLSVDLRYHGESMAMDSGSKTASQLVARHYQEMLALDLEAVKRFLFNEHQKQALNMNKTAIVASDFSASLALMFAEIDWKRAPFDDNAVPALRTPKGQDVRALILISPDTRVAGLNVGSATTYFRNLQSPLFVGIEGAPENRAPKMPILIAVGSKDTQDRGAAKRLVDQMMPKSDDAHVELKTFDTNNRGLDMLNKRLGLEIEMYKFLDEKVKKAPGEWRDRKSPLFD